LSNSEWLTSLAAHSSQDIIACIYSASHYLHYHRATITSVWVQAFLQLPSLSVRFEFHNPGTIEVFCPFKSSRTQLAPVLFEVSIPDTTPVEIFFGEHATFVQAVF
jgi:hypothetical protein